MLKIACQTDLPEIEKLCSDSIIGTRLLCQLCSYGFERSFLEAWILHDDEKATAVLTRFYDDVTLVATDKTDFLQLKTFLSMLGYNSIMCSAYACEKIGFRDFVIKNGYKFNGAQTTNEAEQLTDEDYEEAYELISDEISGSFKKGREAYLSFLSDYTFRQRRGFARGVCTHCAGKISSVAITSAETDKCSVISGVACKSNLRKKGLGKKTVLSIASDLKSEGKTVFVIALNESAEGFYEHIGFEKTEEIAFIERKNDV